MPDRFRLNVGAASPHGSRALLSAPSTTPRVHVAELKRKSVSDLQALAVSLQVTSINGLRKQELIFRIEQALLDAEETLYG